MGRGVGVDAKAHPVDDPVVMKPTQGGEILGVVVSAPGTVFDVMGLEPVAGAAAVDGAGLVSCQHEAPYARWEGGGGLSDT